MELITLQRQLQLVILIFFFRERHNRGGRPTYFFTSVYKKDPSTSKQDERYQKRRKHTDNHLREQLVQASSQEFIFWSYFTPESVAGFHLH